ncbi:hypothetical protein DINM_000094 [Dirofilaria immitis]|nr:hypothetical protein [Dirofilaria immitis]
MVHSSNALLKPESLVSWLNMIPVPIEIREFLYQVYGIEPHTIAYFNEQNPNRIYIIVHGKLNYIDLPVIDSKSSGAIELIKILRTVIDHCDLKIPVDTTQYHRYLLKHGFDLSGDSKTSVGSSKSNKSWQMLTDGEREQLQKIAAPLMAVACFPISILERRKKKAYKTSLCRAFRETNKCENGEACGFAHGEKELRLPPKVHPKYKTQLCNKFTMWNYCPYGARCQFIHQRFHQNMEFINMMNAEDSDPNTDRLSVERVDKSIRYMNPPVALGKHLYYPLENTDFRGAENMGYSIEMATNQSIENAAHGDRSRDNTDPVARNTNLGQLSLVDNNILERLNGRFNNMKMMNNGYVFPQSYFAKSGSSSSNYQLIPDEAQPQVREPFDLFNLDEVQEVPLDLSVMEVNEKETESFDLSVMKMNEAQTELLDLSIPEMNIKRELPNLPTEEADKEEKRKRKRKRQKKKCDVCGRELVGSLKNHMRIHTKEKLYSCSVYERNFAVKGTLTRHMRIHTEEKPYSCLRCGKNFTRKYILEGISSYIPVRVHAFVRFAGKVLRYYRTSKSICEFIAARGPTNVCSAVSTPPRRNEEEEKFAQITDEDKCIFNLISDDREAKIALSMYRMISS